MEVNTCVYFHTDMRNAHIVKYTQEQNNIKHELKILKIAFFFFFFFGFLGPPAAYEGSQARGPIGVVAAGLHHSHSNTASELHLQPTPQFKAMPDP